MASRSQIGLSRTGRSMLDPPAGASPAKVLGIQSVKLSTQIPASYPNTKSKKRKVRSPNSDDDGNEEQELYDSMATCEAQDMLAGIGPFKPKATRKRKGQEPEEKRLRRFRARAPGTYLDRLMRVRIQRMFMIDREKSIGEDDTFIEKFDIAGSTGNIYQVTISRVPTCTCPDASRGNQCKHIIYVMVNVLKAPENLAYQLALISTELAEIFANAPVTPQSSSAAASIATDTGGFRKPIEGDCPVCVMNFDESNKSEDILWCKGVCGNNIHRHCFEQWAKSQPGTPKCVYCRAPWKGNADSIKRISKHGQLSQEGYVNISSELGLSGERDISSYHQFWI
ncbi:RING finger domain protein (Znf1) [Diplocarpon rosae]|nr:RING finger domain protein (Znf1) [Diplocarpon rosae]